MVRISDTNSGLPALIFKSFMSKGMGLNYLAMLELALDIAKGMAHLHKMGVVHANLKVPASTFGFFRTSSY